MNELEQSTDDAEAALHPTVRAFGESVVADPALFALAQQMFDQVPHGAPYDCDPTGHPQLRNFGKLLRKINVALTTPSFFNKTGLAGLPINAMVAWSMATSGGHAFFLHPLVNFHLKAILKQWGAFLQTAASLPALSEHPRTGWFGEDAMKEMPHFDEEFVCEPSLPYRGFSSWDNFFTREFRPGQRPVSAPDDDAVIVNPCESAPYKLMRGVQLHQKFWIKAQPYSLSHMLLDAEKAAQFEGGTVYQAFLSAFSYHRWHSPVSGTILATRVIDGTYYAGTQPEGFDECGPRKSMAYITQLATRALVYIQADHPGIGLMCFMAVGMAEVSTCEVTVAAGQHVVKGEQMGMFHFGGSTCCLLFRPETQLEFDLHGQTPGLEAENLKLNSVIARLRS